MMNSQRNFVRELESVGVHVDSVWDLVNARWSYAPAIPLIIEWLDRSEAEVTPEERQQFREGLVRSLAVKEARGVAAPALIREFKRAGISPIYRWCVGNSLEVVADDSVFDEIAEIARDQNYGRERQMIVLALARMQRQAAVAVLRDLLEDDDVAGHAVIALAKLKAKEARPDVEGLLSHENPWIREEARKALVKLGRGEAGSKS